MKVSTFTISGTKENEIELPLVFSTSFRKDLISNAFTNLNFTQISTARKASNCWNGCCCKIE